MTFKHGVRFICSTDLNEYERSVKKVLNGIANSEGVLELVDISTQLVNMPDVVPDLMGKTTERLNFTATIIYRATADQPTPRDEVESLIQP